MSESTSVAAEPSRRLLLGAVAGAALLAGAGLAVWRLRPGEEGGDAAGFWSLSFTTPQGQSLATANLRGRPLLLNFWATWCPPCVEEFPLLDAFYRENASKGWQVLGLAIDQPSAVRAFLQRMPVTFPIGMAGLEGTELSKTLGNRVGGLPFTVVFGADGGVRHRRMGRVSEGDLKEWARLA
jgi:thiol-disulfide isomerase/thioredoxin